MNDWNGPKHNWFAWHPVRSRAYGWMWLRIVTRYRVFYNDMDGPHSGMYWAYTRRTK